MTKVRGVFHGRDEVNQAIYNLGKESVPSDSIRVYVVDERGRLQREIPVEQESGALRGVTRGAAAGGAVGVLVAVLASGALGIRPIPFGYDSWVAAAMLVVVLALAGIPFGVAFTMGRWRLGDRASDNELARGGAWVEVESDELAETSRRALRGAGASDVSG